MSFKRLATLGALALAALVSGCAVYPAYPVAEPVVYASPGVVYGQPAPVVVAPPPVYYGPAVYPSISIFGRIGGGGHRHHHRGHRRH